MTRHDLGCGLENARAACHLRASTLAALMRGVEGDPTDLEHALVAFYQDRDFDCLGRFVRCWSWVPIPSATPLGEDEGVLEGSRWWDESEYLAMITPAGSWRVILDAKALGWLTSEQLLALNRALGPARHIAYYPSMVGSTDPVDCYRMVHNDLSPPDSGQPGSCSQGVDGFRFWLEPVEGPVVELDLCLDPPERVRDVHELDECDCGWASHLSRHYRVAC